MSYKFNEDSTVTIIEANGAEQIIDRKSLELAIWNTKMKQYMPYGDKSKHYTQRLKKYEGALAFLLNNLSI